VCFLRMIVRSKQVGAFYCNFSKEQSVLPEDDRMIESCRSVFKCFNVYFRLLNTIYVHLLVFHLNNVEDTIIDLKY